MSKRWRVFVVVVAVVVGSAGWWVSGGPSHGSSETTVQSASETSQRAEPPPTLNGAILPASAAVATAEPTSLSSRFQLLRVATARAEAPQGAGEAVIGVDGLPPKTYRVGDAVVGAVVLQSVQPNSATLGPAGGPAAVVLSLSLPSASPAQQQPATRSLPAIRAASSPPVNRSPVIVTDPDHGVDETNR